MWRYFPGTSEPPSNWKNIGFDDTFWQTGTSGFGSGDDQTELSIGLMPVFIRKSFIIDNKQDTAGAILHIDYNDAFVAYLNGVEFARDNIGTPGVLPAYNQGADDWNHEAQIYQAGVPDTFMVSNWQELLAVGENVLSIRAHNIN